MNRLLKKSLPWLVVGATLYFFAQALARNWENIEGISFAPNIYSIIGMLLFVVAVVSSGLLWGAVLNKLSKEKKISARDSVKVYSVSWLLKYIPGQAGSYLNKIAWGVKHGFSKKVITNSFIYENVLLLFASIIPTVPIILLLFADDVASEYQLFIPLLIALPFALVLNRNVFYRVLNWLFQKFRNQTIGKELFLSTKELVSLQLQYIIPRVINGVGFVFIVQSLFAVSVETYLPLVAIYVIAGAVGLLAIFVPSGLGVREAVIVLFASQYFSVEEAIVLSVVARFYATLADAGVFGVYLALNNWRLKQQG